MVLSLNPEISRLPDAELSGIIAGRDTRFDRLDAIRSARVRRSEASIEALGKLLEDEAEPVRLRFAAAVTLARFDVRKIEPVLLEVVRRKGEPRVVRGALRTLGRIGTTRGLNAILELSKSADRNIAEQARFAAILIAYRTRTAGKELAPDTIGIQTLKAPGRSAGKVEVSRFESRIAKRILDQLAEDPISIELDPEAVFDDRCAGVRRLIAFNKAFTGADGAEQLVKAPAVLGLLGAYAEEKDTYSASMTILATPDEGGTGGILTVHTSHGEIVHMGKYDGTRFEVLSADVPGNTAMLITGSYSDGELRLETGECALVSENKRQPQPFRRSLVSGP